MKFEELTKDTEIRASVRKKEYTLAKVSSIPPGDDRIFAIVTDGSEISVVAETGLPLNVTEEEKPLRIISFDTKLPFDLIGFLAYITKLLADQNISLFAISAFSTDHILMKEVYLDKAVKVLKDNKVKIDLK
ncbi:ACT domain-containing protein [Methanomassiliicoccus luminyensis]|uniref:ACT domain-containing protein n=1 Tax=Methanomassiliicoccus luminyensis TaxID=1080712 RepID=UPI00035C982F|nr:ACT domain-containing protein [Methanomassiliicoccus luminyensis]